MREAMDIATIGCAAACKLNAGRIAGLRLAFAVAGPTPLRAWRTEEKALGMVPDQGPARYGQRFGPEGSPAAGFLACFQGFSGTDY